MNPYFGSFENNDEIATQFGETYGKADPDIFAELQGARVLLATYETGNYEGSALVIYEKDGQVYEVEASHCSCNGLEGSWSPAPVTWEYLAMQKTGPGARYVIRNGDAGLQAAWTELVETAKAKAAVTKSSTHRGPK